MRGRKKEVSVFLGLVLCLLIISYSIFVNCLGSIKIRLFLRTAEVISDTFVTMSLYSHHVYEEYECPFIKVLGLAFPVIDMVDVEKAEDSQKEQTSHDWKYEIVNTNVDMNNEHYQDTETETESTAADETGTKTAGETGGSEDGAGFEVSGGIPADSLQIIPEFYSAAEKYYVIPHYTSLSSDFLNPEYIVTADLSVKGKTPCVLIYHTHSSEAFSDTETNGKTIIDVGERLCELLKNDYGYQVYHITSPFDTMGGELDRGMAYTYAEAEISAFIAQHPEIDMVIDLHRDGVDESTHLVTEIDGKKIAKLMLFNGISYSNEGGELKDFPNENRDNNLALTYQVMRLGEEYYPGLFRCIYIESGRYNLHLHKRAMLIEAGAQTNTYDEAAGSMEPLARLIYMELTGGY